MSRNINIEYTNTCKVVLSAQSSGEISKSHRICRNREKGICSPDYIL